VKVATRLNRNFAASDNKILLEEPWKAYAEMDLVPVEASRSTRGATASKYQIPV